MGRRRESPLTWHRMIPLVAPGLGLAITLLGSVLTSPPSAWQHFAVLAFFIVLYWPVGLWLAGYLGGARWQIGVAVVLLAGAVAQQTGAGSLPLNEEVRWNVALAPAGMPGDAVRQRIHLPDPSSLAWQRAWREAVSSVVVVCASEPLPPQTRMTISLNGGTPVDLTTLQRRPTWEGVTWYSLPVTRAELERQRDLEVVVHRTDTVGGIGGSTGSASAPSVCGGQEDARRPGAGGAARWDGQRWASSAFGPTPDAPESAKRPVAQRYYFEVRLYDAANSPRPAVWY
jgi:hypothetical protein